MQKLDIFFKVSVFHCSLMLSEIGFIRVIVVEGSEEESMQARPVYVAAIDLSCKISLLPYAELLLIMFGELFSLCLQAELAIVIYARIDFCLKCNFKLSQI